MKKALQLLTIIAVVFSVQIQATQTPQSIVAQRSPLLPLTEQQRLIQERLKQLVQARAYAKEAQLKRFGTLAHTAAQKDFKSSEIAEDTLLTLLKQMARQYQAKSDTQFASASDETVEIWQKQNNAWACIASLTHKHAAPVTHVAILARNNDLAERIASGELNGNLVVWNRKASKSSNTLEYTQHKLTSHEEGITDLAPLQEAPLTFVSASQDGTLGLHQKHLDGRWETQKIKCHEAPARLLALAGKLVCGHRNGDISLYDYDPNNNALNSTNKFVRSTKLHPSTITCLCACPDDIILSCNDQGHIRLWTSDLECLKRFSLDGTPYPLSACTTLPNGMLAFARDYGCLHEIYFIEDPINSDNNRTIYPTTEHHSDTITSLITAGNQLISGSLDGKINVWG